MFGSNSPFYGPMFEAEHYTSGHQFELFNGLLGGEAEFAFRVNADFPTNVALTTDDLPELIDTGTGAAVMGHPLNSLLWMHNSLTAIGSGLKAGDWISTGTCLGVIKAVPQSTVNISFSGCGEVSYQFN